MNTYREQEEYIRNLKDAAAHAAAGGDHVEEHPPTRLASSRAAMLALTAQLAQGGLRQLTVLGIGIASLGGFAALNAPQPVWQFYLALGAWLLIALGCLAFTAHRLRLFRRGIAYSGRPFSWRADYTASLAVLSTAFGSGAIFLTPAGMSLISAMIICAGVLAMAAVFGSGHQMHKTAALTASVPAAVVALAAALFHLAPAGIMPGARMIALWVGAAGGFCLWLMIANRQADRLIERALKAHPRHEMTQITARHKKASSAYNPFSIRAQQSARNTRNWLQAE